MSAPNASSLKVLNALPGDAWSDAFLAKAPGQPQPMVLRMLKADAAADPQRVERFLAGAQALSGLRHGAVVSVHGAGKTKDGRVYVLTDHVEGDTLAMRSLLPLQQLVDVGVPLADALGAAHALGLVHGALSSARVLLTHEGPRLDFSLAPLLREESADAAGDIRSLAAILQAHIAPGEDRGPFDSSLRRALAGMPDAKTLRDRLVTLRGRWQQDTHASLSAEPKTEVGLPPIDDPDLTGKTLGNYAIEKVIGEGAMGRVYLGRHTRIGRRAAIKVLKAEHARSRELVQRFIQEATAVNAIKNPHIVEVYDFGEDPMPDGNPRVYCVMELLEGIALSDEMFKAPLHVERAVRITQQMARALGAAHAVGVVHRDIKPDNIFLQMEQGDPDFVKVLDFGVAKLLKQIGDLPRSATLAGIVIGTPEYMAPEQALGLGTDLRVDIYAVGLCLYEMLTGVQPFQADTFGKLVVEITSRSPPPLPQRARSGELIPRSLVAVVNRCLQKKPEDRFTTAEELAQALEPFTGREPVEVAPSASDDAAIAAMKPKPGRALLIAALFIGLIGGGGYWALRPYEQAALPEQPKPVEQVTLEVGTTPPGAKVVRTDTGAELGVTPLKLQLARAAETITVRLSLDGREAIERSVSLDGNTSVSVDLPALAPVLAPEPPPPGPAPKAPAPAPKPKKKTTGPVSRDGVVDPFAN